ncbi:MAG: hypothetical protein QOH99_932 [Frankiaceae bacterium]|nr:hypothetical protein [Frankiaceae bacterium]
MRGPSESVFSVPGGWPAYVPRGSVVAVRQRTDLVGGLELERRPVIPAVIVDRFLGSASTGASVPDRACSTPTGTCSTPTGWPSGRSRADVRVRCHGSCRHCTLGCVGRRLSFRALSKRPQDAAPSATAASGARRPSSMVELGDVPAALATSCRRDRRACSPRFRDCHGPSWPSARSTSTVPESADGPLHWGSVSARPARCGNTRALDCCIPTSRAPRRSCCSRSFDARSKQDCRELDRLRGSEPHKLRYVEILQTAHGLAGTAVLHALAQAGRIRDADRAWRSQRATGLAGWNRRRTAP